MGRHRFVAALAAWLSFALPAAVAARIDLVWPRPGDTLAAGAEARIEWRGDPASIGGPAIREWEAFLSVDDGRSYPIRLTPHLDIDLRSRLVRIPFVPTDSARLLLRMGDEHGESVVDLPVRFRIVGSSLADDPFAQRSLVVGEAARPGDRGVVLWAEGARRGGGERWVFVRRSGWASAPTWSPGAGSAEEFDAVDTATTPAPSRSDERPDLAPRRAQSPRPAPLGAVDLLSLFQRRNE